MSGNRRAPAKGKTPAKGRKAPKPSRTRKQWFVFLLKWAVMLGLTGFLLAAIAFYVAYRSIDVPDPNKDFQTQTTFVYYADGKTPIGQFATQNRVSIPYEQMPQNIKDAVVAAEDETFWTNKGIDPKGILRALVNNAQGDAVQGGSTITQQYVKILYLNQERSYTRKVKEAILALKIQRQQSKTQILEGYLNTIYFGRGAYGIQAASQAYFAVDADQLSLRQAAVLAAVLNSPGNMDPADGSSTKQRLRGRYQYVLGRMAKDGMVPEARAARAAKRLPVFPEIKAQSTYGGQKGHVLTLVKNELARIGYSPDQIQGGGLRVTTTLTRKAMTAAEQGVAEAKPEGFGDKFLHIGAASVQPGTGALRGFYAGQDFLQSQINWAVAGGMVGSTFKPIALAAALTDGYSLKDTFDGNSPYTFPDGLDVVNEGAGSGNDYGARVNLIYALEQSINTAFVDLTNSMPDGPAKVYKMAEKMGVPPENPDQSYPGIPNRTVDLHADDTLITLGKSRISPINLANAYATIANGGERADVHVISKVVAPDHDNYTYKNATSRAMSSDVADDVSYAMQQVVKAGTGRNALALGRPAAGKTGTATNGQDQVSSSWFVGFTPQLATAVMYVRGDGDNQLDGWLPSYFGADYPTRTWTAIMRRDMDGVDVESFPPPAYVDGDAPESGHEPTYAPKPTKKPSKTPTTKTPTPTVSDTPTPTPTEEPTTAEPSPTQTDCGILGCSSSAPPSPSESPSTGGNQGNGVAMRRNAVADGPSPATLAFYSVEPWWWPWL